MFVPRHILFVKPILTSEKNAIEEAVESAEYAESVGASRISFCPATIHKDTLMETSMERRCIPAAMDMEYNGNHKKGKGIPQNSSYNGHCRFWKSKRPLQLQKMQFTVEKYDHRIKPGTGYSRRF